MADSTFPEETPESPLRSEKLEDYEIETTQPNAATFKHFLLGVPVKIFIVAADVTNETKRLWHQIKIEHGPFKWTIHKTLLDIFQLEVRLNAHRVWAKMAGRRAVDAESFEESEKNRPEEKISDLPVFTPSKEIDMLQEVQETVEAFLSFVVSYDTYRNHPYTSKFFEISFHSLKPELGPKYREGFLEKRASCCCIKNAMWEKKWFVLKESFIMYTDKDGTIEGVFLFDNKSIVELEGDIGPLLKISNQSYRLILKCGKRYEAQLWRSAIESRMIALAGNHPFGSFAPARQCPANWYVDGCDYFSAVADALERAREEIFIGGWSIGPQIYLKRPKRLDDRWMLQSLLKRKADAGVKVYLFIYDAPDSIVNLGDEFVKETLEDLNKDNIRVLRHRGRVIEGSILWSHHEKLVIVDQKIAFVSGIDLTFGRWDDKSHPLHDHPEDDEAEDEPDGNKFRRCKWPGIDYVNHFINGYGDLKNPFTDTLDRSKDPRTPWHDVASVTLYEGARDVARHFIERWNYIRATERGKDVAIPFLLPKTIPTEEEKQTGAFLDATEASVQVLRSVSEWSNGVQKTEMSIHAGYIEAIEQSEHFVYIENQFFISVHNDEDIKNKVVTALLGRIVRAKAQREKFRVFVVLPLVPGFEGDFSKDSQSREIQVIAYYQYRSICRGHGSLVAALIETLTEEEIKEYVSFCSLRAYGELNGQPITEVLYVHSKLLIVDDRVAIIGSANINDRSLCGDRDSEVVIRVQDTEMVNSAMGGKEYQAGKFVSGLRKRIFAEHLGLLPDDYDGSSDFPGSEEMRDVTSDEFYHYIWQKTARSNTEIFEEVFRPVPTDKIRRFSEVQDFQTAVPTDAEKKRSKLQSIKGFLVEFPLRYLEAENLLPDTFSSLNVAPDKFWT